MATLHPIETVAVETVPQEDSHTGVLFLDATACRDPPNTMDTEGARAPPGHEGHTINGYGMLEALNFIYKLSKQLEQASCSSTGALDPQGNHIPSVSWCAGTFEGKTGEPMS